MIPPVDPFLAARGSAHARSSAAAENSNARLEALLFQLTQTVNDQNRQIAALETRVVVLQTALEQQSQVQEAANFALDSKISANERKFNTKISALERVTKFFQTKIDKLQTHTHTFCTNSGQWGTSHGPNGVD